MADDNFLEPADDTPVSVAAPEEDMPGLSGHIIGLNSGWYSLLSGPSLSPLPLLP